MTTHLSFAEVIRHHRLKAGLTQVELARKAGAADSYVTLLETGRRRNPGRRLVEAFAAALGLTKTERAEFLAAAHYTSQPVLRDLPKTAHPLVEAVQELLALPPESAQLSTAIRRVVGELLGAAVTRKAGYEDRRLLRAAALTGMGYFHRAPGSPGQKPSSSGLTAKQAKLGARLWELLAILVDGRVPITKRLGLADELVSLARWKRSQMTPGRPPDSEPMSRGGESTGT
jgi:transcriptional regulator with XRE-family HTH domain